MLRDIKIDLQGGRGIDSYRSTFKIGYMLRTTCLWIVDYPIVQLSAALVTDHTHYAASRVVTSGRHDREMVTKFISKEREV